MGLFKNLNNDGLEKTADTLGGYTLFDSDAYLGTIKVAYVHTADSGAMAIALQIGLGDKDYNETIYVTNKSGENFFLNQNDKTKKIPLPGYTLINDLCMVTTEKPLSDQESEEKMVNIYDPAERKAVPRGAQVLVDLVGKTAYFGIIKRTVNKNVKNQSGQYEPTDETREENGLIKVFHDPTKLTLNEVMKAQEDGAFPESPAFFEAWVDKNKGKTIDARKNKSGGGAKSGKPGGPPQAGANAPKTNSLFGNK